MSPRIKMSKRASKFIESSGKLNQDLMDRLDFGNFSTYLKYCFGSGFDGSVLECCFMKSQRDFGDCFFQSIEFLQAGCLTAKQEERRPMQTFALAII